jgi:two-component system, OmpR family, phosphate regulon sensor histidine kinase PhoR
VKKEKKRSRPLLLFYLLVAYVFIQFIWWSYHLFQLNNEVYDLRLDLIVQKAGSSSEIIQAGEELQYKLQKRWSMIVGEGMFFLVLLVLGIIRIRNTFKKEAALANQQRNFLLSITHELKTPIASTRLQLETLHKRELDREKQKEILTNAISDTDRLTKLVENMLLAARIDNSSYDLHREPTDLSAFVQQVMDSNIDWLQRKHIVRTDIKPGIMYPIDKLAFESVVLNLAENAAKYSPQGTTVSVSLYQKGSRIMLEVKDEGPGVAESEKAHIFKKFYRAGNEETRNTKGTGLGLYIVKYLVEQHGGKINIRNNTPSGSIFEVCLG